MIISDDPWVWIDLFIQTAAVVLFVWGLIESGNLRLRGPLLALGSELCFIWVGIMHDAWSVFAVGVIIGVVQLRNFVKWYKKGRFIHPCLPPTSRVRLRGTSPRG